MCTWTPSFGPDRLRDRTGTQICAQSWSFLSRCGSLCCKATARPNTLELWQCIVLLYFPRLCTPLDRLTQPLSISIRWTLSQTFRRTSFVIRPTPAPASTAFLGLKLGNSLMVSLRRREYRKALRWLKGQGKGVAVLSSKVPGRSLEKPHALFGIRFTQLVPNHGLFIRQPPVPPCCPPLGICLVWMRVGFLVKNRGHMAGLITRGKWLEKMKRL